MGAIGLEESVEWSLASSALTKCSSVCCTAINILRSILKAALSCLVLCWRAKDILVSADRQSCCCPQEFALLLLQQYSSGHAHWWRSVSSDFLVLGGCESKLSSCTLVCLPTLPDLLLPVPPGYCDTGVWLAVTVKAWREESGVFLEATGAVPATSSFSRVVSLAGVPISAILGLGSVMGHAEFCFVYFQPLAALTCSEQPPTSDLVILLPLISGPRTC